MKNLFIASSALAAFMFGAACSTTLNPSAAGASGIPKARNVNKCLTQEEKNAFNSRVLQTELMVAALSCSEHKKNYNNFINKYQGQLTKQGKALQAYFKRNYGPLGEARLNKFVTKLANDTSEVNYGQQEKGYCRYADDQFDRLKNLKPADFEKFLTEEEFAVSYIAPTCE